MPTYQDVTNRIRALSDDLPNHWADDNHLLSYVNMAQGQLVSVLASQGCREGVRRASMLVPAGTSRIERWPTASNVPNEVLYSDAFALAAAPNGWVSVSGTPTVTSGVADPESGTGAKRWTFASGSNFDLYVAGVEIPQTLSFFGSGSLWLKTPDVNAPHNVRVTVGLADNSGPLAGTTEYRDCLLTDEWQRVFVPFSGKTLTAAPSGPLRRFLRVTVNEASPVIVDLFRAVVRPGYADTADVATGGHGAVLTTPPVLPGWLVVPDRILERKPGNPNNTWTLVRGPLQVRDAPGNARLVQWDWRSGGIDLGPATEDREMMIEGWGTLEDGQLGSNVIEEELPINGSLEALAAIAAGIIAQARGQMAQAAALGVMTEQGSFSGMAGGLTMNLVNTFNKAQQSEPIRRQPYFGVARYPGVAGNGVGGWPWNSV